MVMKGCPEKTLPAAGREQMNSELDWIFRHLSSPALQQNVNWHLLVLQLLRQNR